MQICCPTSFVCIYTVVYLVLLTVLMSGLKQAIGYPPTPLPPTPRPQATNYKLFFSAPPRGRISFIMLCISRANSSPLLPISDYDKTIIYNNPFTPPLPHAPLASQSLSPSARVLTSPPHPSFPLTFFSNYFPYFFLFLWTTIATIGSSSKTWLFEAFGWQVK